MDMRNMVRAAHAADDIIAAEVGRQDAMWGVANTRADAADGQLLAAGVAQAYALWARRNFGVLSDDPPAMYPKDWSGFRDYGSDVANLAVAAAFLRQEIKRLIAQGADTTRTSRTQPYTGNQPAIQL